jgi:hypothetical protein
MENGQSGMQFKVGVQKLAFRSGSVVKTDMIGTWSATEPENFQLKSGQSLGGMAAKTVYKIVTVVVRIQK